MKKNYKKIFLISFSIVVIVFIFNYVYRELYLEAFYQNFNSNIKWGDKEHYILAYSNLYSLVYRSDFTAMNLISESYMYGYGIEKDLIKANIWDQRSQCKCFDTGIKEYNVYQKYLLEKNYLKAQEFLLLAANNGNKKAILHLKDDSYLEDNFLNISEKDRKYWKVFEYEKLYPYIDKIMSDPSLSDK